MTLIPTARVDLGRLRYESQIPAVVATLSLLPGVSAFTVVLPAGVELTAATGDSASLTLDGGEGAKTVLTGRVRGFRRRLLQTEVRVADGSADLATLRPAATYERQGGKEVIRGLAGEAGVQVGQLDLDLGLAAYVAHQRRSAAEHVAHLAALGGAIALTDAEGRLTVLPRPSRAEAALLHGREILEYQVSEHRGSAAQRVVIGGGPAGTPEAPEALQQSGERLPEDAPAPGAGALWQPAPLLRTPKAASLASQARQAAVAAAASRLLARCFLLPSLRPGMVLQVQELPEGLTGGPWLLTRVTHRLEPTRGGETILAGIAAGAAGGALLGAALGAVGGLL